MEKGAVPTITTIRKSNHSRGLGRIEEEILMAIIRGLDTEQIDYSVEAFKSVYDKENSDGFSHKNRFSMQIQFPSFVTSAPDAISTNLMIESTTIPGNRILVREYQFDGPLKKYPYSTAVEEVTISFLLDGNYSIHKAFSEWLYAIINMDTYTVAYKDDIVATQEVYQLDKFNRKKYGMRMIDAFPIMITPIELSNTTPNDIQRANITFVFDRYDILTT
jgi:hypothetical protein